jgi:hypothetical protein
VKIVKSFGEPWGEERLQGVPRGSSPIGDACMYCGVPIKAGDQGIVVEATKQFGSSDEPTLAPLHRECYGPWTDESSAALNDELFRLRARSEDVGAVDGISVQDRGRGNAVLRLS